MLKLKIGLAAVFAVAFAAAAYGDAPRDLVPVPAQPDGLGWPTNGWATGDIDDAQTAASVDRLIAAMMAGEVSGPIGQTRALVVVHRGRLVREAYAEGFGPDTPQISWSLSKSIVQALVGHAVEAGLVSDIDAAMPSPWPEDDPRAAITWRHYLTMSDGLAWQEAGGTDVSRMGAAQLLFGASRFDVIEGIKTLQAEFPPGTNWNYSTPGFLLASAAVQKLVHERAGGTGDAREQMRSFAERALLDPLGMTAQIEFDAAGHPLTGAIFWAGRA